MNNRVCPYNPGEVCPYDCQFINDHRTPDQWLGDKIMEYYIWSLTLSPEEAKEAGWSQEQYIEENYQFWHQYAELPCWWCEEEHGQDWRRLFRAAVDW